MSEIIKLKNTYDWLNGHGIFTQLHTKDIPWKTNITAQSLEDDYVGNHSGNKPVSPLVEKLLNTDNELTDANLSRLATTLFNKYNDSWTRAWEALQVEYDPLNNYDMTEKETPAETQHDFRPAGTTETITPAETTTTNTPAETTETLTPAETTKTTTPAETTVTTNPAKIKETHKPAETTETITPTKTTTEITPSTVADKVVEEDKIFGFDSSSGHDSNKRETNTTHPNTTKGKEQITDATNEVRVNTTQHDEETTTEALVSGSEVYTTQEAETEKVETDAAGTTKIEVDSAGTEKFEVDVAGTNILTVQTDGYDKYTTKKDRELTRSGNIGVTTSQQMLQSELDLRIAYNFFDSLVYKDIDKVLCCDFYTSDSKLY